MNNVRARRRMRAAHLPFLRAELQVIRLFMQKFIRGRAVLTHCTDPHWLETAVLSVYQAVASPSGDRTPDDPCRQCHYAFRQISPPIIVE